MTWNSFRNCPKCGSKVLCNVHISYHNTSHLCIPHYISSVHTTLHLICAYHITSHLCYISSVHTTLHLICAYHITSHLYVHTTLHHICTCHITSHLYIPHYISSVHTTLHLICAPQCHVEYCSGSVLLPPPSLMKPDHVACSHGVWCVARHVHGVFTWRVACSHRVWRVHVASRVAGVCCVHMVCFVFTG